MAIVNGMTAEKMLELAGEQIIGGEVDIDGHLILTRRNEETLDAGEVIGADGIPGSPGAPGEDAVLPLGTIFEYPLGATIPPNCLAMGQSVLASVYTGLAALKPSWVSGPNLVLPSLPVSSVSRDLVKPASVVGGTLQDTGRILFSGVSSVSLNSLDDRYDNYEVIWVVDSASADYGVYVRFRASGSDDASGYAGSYMESVNSTAWSGSTDTTSARVGRMSSAGASGQFTLFQPRNAAVVTRVIGRSIDNSAYQSASGHRLATAKAHDGFTLVGPASMTGYLEVYGLKAKKIETQKIIVASDSTGEYSPTVQAALISKVNALSNVKQTVVATASATSATGSSGTWTDLPGMSVSITPTKPDSKILVRAVVQGAATYDALVRLLRGATPIGIGSGSSTNQNGSTFVGSRGDTYEGYTGVIEFIDSPGTTSPVTYKLQFQQTSGGGSFFYLNRTPNSATDEVTISTITVSEIPI